jgi:dipeptidyl aminopeptidase/acylaminoacyl peptidase
MGPNTYTLLGSLGPFPLMGLESGPVRPSPDGKLFSMNTRESAGLGEPYFNYVYVFDAALNIVFKLQDYYHPTWLGNDRLVVASGSNLYTVTVAASPVVTRVGAEGLGLPNEGTSLPSVSSDGGSIAFIQGEAVWRINVDGSGLAQLTKPRIDVGWPAWSPDGSRLVVSRAPCQFFDTGGSGQGRTDKIVIISATATNQDLDVIRPVTIGCGPVYWLP